MNISTDDRIVNFWAKLFQTFEVTATNELIHLKPIEEYANGSSNSIEGQTSVVFTLNLYRGFRQI